MKNYQIACVVVTYNRKSLLKRCLEAIVLQEFKPRTVYIVDNASTDGTSESVKEWGFYECENEKIYFKYIRNKTNEGGAGGFYIGMKTAYEESKYDAIWVMDDDGIPEKKCLEVLCSYLEKFDYVAPIVLSDEDNNSCSFAPHYEDVKYFAEIKGAQSGVIKDWASPFNAVLYSCKLITKVGYPKKEMFIWGDEVNYHLRSKRAGYIPYTILEAVHYHPLNRQEYGSYLGRSIVKNISADWKLYCYLRNVVYNQLRLESKFPNNIYRVMRISLSIITYYHKKGKKYSLLLSAAIAGFLGYFDGLQKYLNK